MNIHIFIIFLIFSFLGAVMEHVSYYIDNTLFNSAPRILSNPILAGFPLYGCCGLLIWYVYDKFLQNCNYVLLFFIFAILITTIEYIVGINVGAGKTTPGGIDSWDYSDQSFNYKGIISLKHFIAWGLLGLIVINIYPILYDKISLMKL